MRLGTWFFSVWMRILLLSLRRRMHLFWWRNQCKLPGVLLNEPNKTTPHQSPRTHAPSESPSWRWFPVFNAWNDESYSRIDERRTSWDSIRRLNPTTCWFTRHLCSFHQRTPRHWEPSGWDREYRQGKRTGKMPLSTLGIQRRVTIWGNWSTTSAYNNFSHHSIREFCSSSIFFMLSQHESISVIR